MQENNFQKLNNEELNHASFRSFTWDATLPTFSDTTNIFFETGDKSDLSPVSVSRFRDLTKLD